MHPALSVIFFTTLAGAAQGLVVMLAVAVLTGSVVPHSFMLAALAVALVLLLAGLVASTFHLGRPERAWRAMAMWRTSWLSREVIVLPAFIALVAVWLLLEVLGLGRGWAPLLALASVLLAALLWLCTAMIYACLKFIQEWAHPLTLVNYVLLGLASGLLLAAVLAGFSGASSLARGAAGWGLVVTLAAAATKLATLMRNARLKPVSTLASATGLRGSIRQTSMGMSGGAFNTREFFHGKPMWFVRRARLATVLLAFALPVLLLSVALATGGALWLLLAFVVQYLGLLAERWLFFAQARHPQNLYYQVVS